ncbi:hypothetical protein [Streptomyces mangrovisoli]|uniref:Uncharacterized protein n=1 Tax=Streptomyces mangrovisoli TaxID=1428628 RepID=A0A1J4NSL5_9ACTN|nr:hypothetical protein [Streptomyces mangrovisoli]OIJ64134.1 hypothetical protein WN71_030470 [Streptomyces mangrovisoli]
MNDLYPLARAEVDHPEAPGDRGTLELFAGTDPALPVAPGQEIDLTLVITPGDRAHRTYGYLLEDFLGTTATLVRHPGLSRLPSARLATYASGAEPRTAACRIRVAPDAPEGTVLLPRVVVGLVPSQGAALVASGAISHEGFRVRRHWLPGEAVTLRPGGHAELPAGHSPAPGLRLLAAGRARHGRTSCGPDGAVSYRADPDHLGYDRFELAYEDPDGHRVWTEVTVHIGDLGPSPGAVAVHG